MWDSLQDGIVVIAKEQMHFMNDLSNKILTQLAKVENFYTEAKECINDPERENPMDAKIFFVFDTDYKAGEKNDKKKKKKQKKKAKKNVIPEGAEPTEYSLRQIAALPSHELKSKIFVFEKKLMG